MGMNKGIDLNDLPEIGTSVGTTNALGMSGMADDPVFEFTVMIVVLTSNGASAD